MCRGAAGGDTTAWPVGKCYFADIESCQARCRRRDNAMGGNPAQPRTFFHCKGTTFLFTNKYISKLFTHPASGWCHSRDSSYCPYSTGCMARPLFFFGSGAGAWSLATYDKPAPPPRLLPSVPASASPSVSLPSPLAYFAGLFFPVEERWANGEGRRKMLKWNLCEKMWWENLVGWRNVANFAQIKGVSF